MKTLRFFRVMLLLFFILMPASSSAQEISVNWWNDNTVTAEGHGFPPSNAPNIYEARNLSKRAAIADGYRASAEKIRGVYITAETTINDKIISGDVISTDVNALIRGSKILSEEYDEYGGCKVVLSVSIYGVTSSVAKLIFKPVDKEEFPLPIEEKVAEGNYTGLIIDCGDSDLKPVLSPVIRNADNISVYSYNNLDYDKVIAGGVVTYATKDAPSVLNTSAKFLSYGALIDRKLLLVTAQISEKNIARAGDNPLIIKAAGMSDDNTCPVISTEDADKILSENQASHFLDEGAVVFTSYRIGGLRA